MGYHLYFTCFSKIAPILFSDKIAKRWGETGGKGRLRSTKGDYLCIQGIHPWLQQDLLETLCQNIFSLDIDESSVLNTTQSDVNINFSHEGVWH